MNEEPQIPFRGRKGSHPVEDSFFENLLSDFSLLGFEDIFSKLDPIEFIEHLNSDFQNFLKGCQWIIKSKSENAEDTLNQFKYILNRFQIQKRIIFSEMGEQIFHTLCGIVSIESEGSSKIAYYQYEFINKAISILEGKIKELTPKEKTLGDEPVVLRLRKTRLHGFRIKNKDRLETAFDRLKFNGLINQNVRFSDFERAFTDWLPENKITWLAGPGLLSYFIKSINGKGIEDEKKDIWITTINCFYDENMQDYNKDQLRFAKKPTKTNDVDLVIKTINRN